MISNLSLSIGNSNSYYTFYRPYTLVALLIKMVKNQSQIKVLKKLGMTIQKERKELGYSQEAFAHQCGLHRIYMGVIERGERNISMLNILKISKALNLKISEFFNKADL